MCQILHSQTLQNRYYNARNTRTIKMIFFVAIYLNIIAKNQYQGSSKQALGAQ